jgi:GNAT superfamily N-acetyltransferase
MSKTTGKTELRGSTAPQLRVATSSDLDSIRLVIDRAIYANQRAFLTPGQIGRSREIMGLDTRLILDGTYFVVEIGGELAACGGWSRRKTLYGHNQSAHRSDELLEPGRDAARVRAMYTDPRFVRRGFGRIILDACEQAARTERFDRLELVATLAGEPLYVMAGFTSGERFVDNDVPLVRMTKILPPIS